MKKPHKPAPKLDDIPEIDFSKSVRGKYFLRAIRAKNLVVLAPDVLKVFPDSDAVNDALRLLIRAASQWRRSA